MTETIEHTHIENEGLGGYCRPTKEVLNTTACIFGHRRNASTAFSPDKAWKQTATWSLNV